MAKVFLLNSIQINVDLDYSVLL